MINLTPLSCFDDATPLASADAPIGIFDSGIGGLSIALEIAQYLPKERIVYFADTAHVPYGARGDEDIRQLTARAIEWLYRQGCKVAVVACNTASAFSLDHLREYYGERFPIIGLVPALKPAVIQSKSKVVAVLATPATLRGKLIQDVITGFAEPAEVKVLNVTCLELVPLVESGLANSVLCLECLQQVLQPVVEQGADYLVLGCTHYPFLKDSIQQLYADRLTLVDSGFAVARQTSKILIKHGLLTQAESAPEIRLRCYVSGQNATELAPVLQHMIPTGMTWSIENIVAKMAEKIG
ncbi:glutamate racemase [Acinetobacter calcoaceticus]|uniref:Glutamate racemase n=1 Tax=Acinetobacter calcoaceticus TaxID=471 RepID=A0A4R1Y5B0_ACICA|nr:glutamate racemase [Acinetobacter calcoaceticus]